MPLEEAILTGTIRLAAESEQRLEGRAFVIAAQPDLEVDGDGEYMRDGDGEYIVLGIWDSSQLQGFVEIDLSVIDAALPRTGLRQQIADLEVWYAKLIGPGTFAPYVQLNPIEVDVNLVLGGPASWSFSLPYKKRNPLRLTESTRQIPALTGVMGSPYGHGSLMFRGAYLTDTGVKRTTLVRIGVAAEAELSYQRGQSVAVISGGDQLSELEGQNVSYLSIPPGSGLPRGVVAGMLAAQHGFNGDIWSGTPMNRDFQVVNEPSLPRIYELADADNMAIQQGEDGGLTALPEVDTSSPIVMVIEPRDLVASEGVTLNSPGANPPTRISISGTEPVLREDCGVRTLPPRISTSLAPYAVKTSLATQDSAGTITVGGAAESANLQMVNRTTTRLTYDCDTLMIQETEIEGWYNPETWRYQYVADDDGVDGVGDYGAYHNNVHFYDAAVVKNDSTPAYFWNRERFGTIGKQRTSYTYDARNFLTQTEEVKEGWLTAQRAIKTRASKAVAFEVTNHSNVRILANGISAVGRTLPLDGEAFVGEYGGFVGSFWLGGPAMLERTRVQNSVRDDGYITTTITTREAWGAEEGSGQRYLYGDGSQRNRAEYAFLEVERITENYYEAGDAARKVTERRGMGGKILEVIDEDIEGYFPVAEQRVDIEPDPALYVGREHLLEQARAASRREGKPIHYDYAAPGLETRYPTTMLREEFALAENMADLEKRAQTRIQLHSAMTVSFTLLANYLLRPGVRVHLRVPEADIDADVHVVAVNNSRQGMTAPRLTRCTGRIYVA